MSKAHQSIIKLYSI